jgi:hypothetical protein
MFYHFSITKKDGLETMSMRDSADGFRNITSTNSHRNANSTVAPSFTSTCTNYSAKPSASASASASTTTSTTTSTTASSYQTTSTTTSVSSVTSPKSATTAVKQPWKFHLSVGTGRAVRIVSCKPVNLPTTPQLSPVPRTETDTTTSTLQVLTTPEDGVVEPNTLLPAKPKATTRSRSTAKRISKPKAKRKAVRKVPTTDTSAAPPVVTNKAKSTRRRATVQSPACSLSTASPRAHGSVPSTPVLADADLAASEVMAIVCDQTPIDSSSLAPPPPPPTTATDTAAFASNTPLLSVGSAGYYSTGTPPLPMATPPPPVPSCSTPPAPLTMPAPMHYPTHIPCDFASSCVLPPSTALAAAASFSWSNNFQPSAQLLSKLPLPLPFQSPTMPPPPMPTGAIAPAAPQCAPFSYVPMMFATSPSPSPATSSSSSPPSPPLPSTVPSLALWAQQPTSSSLATFSTPYYSLLPQQQQFAFLMQPPALPIQMLPPVTNALALEQPLAHMQLLESNHGGIQFGNATNGF